MSSSRLVSLVLCLLLVTSAISLAQQAPARITGAIEPQQLITLPGGIPAQVKSQNDRGPVSPSLKLSYMTLLTVPSASQQKDLQELLAQQQDPASPQYHQWLTSEQYADRFGLSAGDIQKLTSWLQSDGFTIVSVSPDRNFIVFSGTAAQAESAFRTQIHTFVDDGQTHFSNISSPSIPAALSGIVTGVRGLSNFHLKPQVRIKPQYSYPIPNTNPQEYSLYVAPGDIATEYDLTSLYSAGITGSGYKLAVIGQTDVYLADLVNFRSTTNPTGFALPAITGCTANSTTGLLTSCGTGSSNLLQYVLVNTDPGTISSTSDLGESDLDLELSGAVAYNAQIIFVNAPDPNGNGVFDSWYYAVAHDVAPVITMSYGTCEYNEALYEAQGGVGEGTISSDEAELQTANAKGITFMSSSGDAGAAGCDATGTTLATGGLAVNYPASSPEVTGVGGTMVAYDISGSGAYYGNTYWNTTNGTNGGSLKQRVPEDGWNDDIEFGAYCAAGVNANFCNQFTPPITDQFTAQEIVGASAGGGGVSNCTALNASGQCSGGFSQPSWQTVTISGQSAGRFVPDVSLLASPSWPGYIWCTPLEVLANSSEYASNTSSSCANGISSSVAGITSNNQYLVFPSIVGGTSASSPIFAGIVTLLNQYLVTQHIQSSPGLGNINPLLYKLAGGTYAAGSSPFHQLTGGTDAPAANTIYCQPGTPTGQATSVLCPAAVSPATEGIFGYDAASADSANGYNLVTGLGSVDAYNLATAWAAAGIATTTTTLTSTPNPANYGASVTFTATVTTTGSTAPTGTVTFYNGVSSIGTGTLNGSNPDQATFSTSTLVLASNSITAVYAGDSANATSTSAAITQVINEPTFTIAVVTPPPTSTLAGQTATATLSLTPTSSGTFAGAVSLSCTTPTGAVGLGCSVSPSTINLGSGATTVTVNMTTTGPNGGTQSGIRQRRAENRVPLLPFSLPLAGVVFAGFAGRKGSKQFAVAALCVSLALAGLLVACGGSSSAPVAITMTPTSASLYPNYTGWPSQGQTFNASVSNTSNTAVTWSLSSSLSCTASSNPCGTLSGGAYTAPTVGSGFPGSVTVTATSQASATATATATVTLKSVTIPTAIVGSPYTITVSATEAGTTNLQNISLTTN